MIFAGHRFAEHYIYLKKISLSNLLAILYAIKYGHIFLTFMVSMARWVVNAIDNSNNPVDLKIKADTRRAMLSSHE